MAYAATQDLSIVFPVFDYASRSVRQTAIRLGSGQKAGPTLVHALRGVSVEFRNGDRVGLIGHNGSGKSTLLRALAGVYLPTHGTVTIDGTRTSLFNIRAGMDDEASGIENVMLLGVSAGLSRREVSAMTDDILAFADLGEAIRRPVRTYSAGMQLRLAFSVATAKSAAIVLIDEGIGAGDANFQKKAKARIEGVIGSANILVLASHDNKVLRADCNRGLVMAAGRIAFDGPIDEAVRFSKEQSA